MAERVAWIAQEFFDPAFDEPRRPPEICAGMDDLPPFARAHGHIDSAVGLGEEGDWETVEEAIAWARQRAPRVLVRVGYSTYYSAGREASANHAPWPPTPRAIREETRR